MAGTRISSRQSTREVVLDAVLTEQLGATYDVAKDTLEEGAETSDHIHKKSRTFSLSGVMGAITFGDYLSSDPDRLRTARAELLAIGDERGTVDVVSGYDALAGYAIESIAFGREAPESGKLSVEITLSQIRTTAAQTTQLLAKNAALEFQAGMTNLTLGGEQQPAESEGTDIKNEVAEAHQSVAYSLLNGGGLTRSAS